MSRASWRDEIAKHCFVGSRLEGADLLTLVPSLPAREMTLQTWQVQALCWTSIPSLDPAAVSGRTHREGETIYKYSRRRPLLGSLNDVRVDASHGLSREALTLDPTWPSETPIGPLPSQPPATAPSPKRRPFLYLSLPLSLCHSKSQPLNPPDHKES